MKKAKEYADEVLTIMLDPLNVNNTEQGIFAAIKGVIFEIGFDETIELCTKRNISTDAGFISLLREQCQKYQAFVRHVNSKTENHHLGIVLKPDSLKEYYLTRSNLAKYAEKI